MRAGGDEETVSRAPVSRLSNSSRENDMNREGLSERALSKLENATKDKEFTAGTTWTFDDGNTDENATAISPDRDIKEMNDFMENFEAEISLEGREKTNSRSSSGKMENKFSTPSKRDSEGEINVAMTGGGEVINGMVRVQSLGSTGRYSPSIAAQEDNHDLAEGNVDDFLDEMEELVDEK